MQFNIKKRFFNIGKPVNKTTLSIPLRMYEALTFISKSTGDSIPEIICEALEQWLTHLAKEGHITFPKEEIVSQDETNVSQLKRVE